MGMKRWTLDQLQEIMVEDPNGNYVAYEDAVNAEKHPLPYANPVQELARVLAVNPANFPYYVVDENLIRYALKRIDELEEFMQHIDELFEKHQHEPEMLGQEIIDMCQSDS